MNTNTCPCEYSIDELNCDKCIECSLFPCSYYEDDVDVDNEVDWDEIVEENHKHSEDEFDFPDYYGGVLGYDALYDDPDAVAWENEQRELHYGVNFRDQWTLDE